MSSKQSAVRNKNVDWASSTDKVRNRIGIKILLTALILSVVPVSVAAYDLNDKVSIGAAGTGVAQYGNYTDAFTSGGNKISDTTRGSVAVDLQGDFQATERDQFQVIVSFAAGNGLNKLGGVSVALNADDLEDDLKDINGRNRDYLLVAWYKHTFDLGENLSLGVTGGIIDATAYVDGNSYANDQISQFMNEVFVNRFSIPSYDPGAVLEFAWDKLRLFGIWMNTRNGPDDEGGTEFNYYAFQAGYKLESSLGEGNYRILFDFTDDKLRDRDDPDEKTNFTGFDTSIDQQLSEIFGVFLRIGLGSDDPIDQVHDALYSGGLNINGKLWGRAEDEVGLGYAYLDGAGNQDGAVRHTQVAEAYARFQLNKFADVSVDLQYVQDEVRGEPDPEVWVVGGRFNAYF